jgi:PAS domain S-box-containing protein
MPRNGHKQSKPYKDELLFELEMRQTRSQMELERLEIRCQAVQTTLQRFKKLYDNSPIGFITFDHSARILNMNRAAATLLEVAPASVFGLSITILISVRSCPRFMEHLRTVRRANGEAVSTHLEMIAGKHGRTDVQLVTSAVLIGHERIFETALIDLTAQKAAAEAILRAREHAESIVSTIPYPVLVVDAKTRVIGANAAFYFLFLTSDSQVVNWPITELPDVTWPAPIWEDIIRKTMAEGRPVEGMIVRAETRRGSALILNANIRRLNSVGPAVREEYLLIAFEDITRRQRAEEERELILAELQESQARLEVRVKERTEELNQSYAQLRALGEQLVLAHEQEQRRIARELHDQIGQDLTALKITLSRGKSANQDEAKKALQEAAGITEELLQTVRSICGSLRPQVLDDLGLIPGIQWHIKTFAARTGVEITFDIGGAVNEDRLTPIVKSTIFRVIQEALTNVSRHAKTNVASVILSMRNGSVDFSIRDGGAGFDPTDIAKRNSTGISSMRERISLVSGKFEIASSPGQGTIINARIPVPHNDYPTLKSEENENRSNHGKSSSNQNRIGGRSSPGAQGTKIPSRQ